MDRTDRHEISAPSALTAQRSTGSTLLPVSPRGRFQRGIFHKVRRGVRGPNGGEEPADSRGRFG